MTLISIDRELVNYPRVLEKDGIGDNGHLLEGTITFLAIGPFEFGSLAEALIGNR